MNYQEGMDLLRLKIRNDCNRTFRDENLKNNNFDVWFERQQTLSYVLGLIDAVEARCEEWYTHK